MDHTNITRHSCLSFGSCEAIDVYLFKNGQKDLPPRKYHLTRNDLQFWDNTLKYVADTESESLSTTKDYRLELYKLNGEKISGPLELENGAAYVVVQPNDTFKDSGYEMYMVQASKSMERRFKQTSNKDIVVNTVSTYNNIAGRKFKKKIIGLEANQKTEPRNKIVNLTQISNVTHNRTWPVKKKDEGTPQKGGRPTPPSPRKSSPVKRTVKKKESLTPQNNNTRTTSKEMVAENKKNGVLEGPKSGNVGKLLDLFRDMDIQRNLEHENTRLLVLLNEKKIVSKNDAGTQSLIIKIDEGTDPPINLIEYDEKGIQKPSNTSVCRNFTDDNYVALMQPEALINITIEASQNKDCIETKITSHKNVEIIKLEDKTKDKAAQFCVDTSLSGKVIIDTKIIKFVAIRCVSNKFESNLNYSGNLNMAKTMLPSTVLELENNGGKRIAENQTKDRRYKPELPTPSNANGSDIENNFKFKDMTKNITHEDFNNTTLKNMSQTKVIDNKRISKQQAEPNVNLSRGSQGTLNKVSNQSEVTSSKNSALETIKTESSIHKLPKRVSMCLEEDEGCVMDEGQTHPSIVEEPIVLLDGSQRVLDATSRNFSITIETIDNRSNDNNSNGSHIVLPTHQRKSCNIMKDEQENALLPLHRFSIDNVLASKQSKSNHEIGTLSSIQIVEKINQQNQKNINVLNEATDMNENNLFTCHSTGPSTSQIKSPSSSQKCDGCNYIPPPCVPTCTPINCVTPVNSRHTMINCQCPDPNSTTSEYIQTDSCEVLLMVRRQRDNSQFSFHFPSIKDLKDYKLI